ncbi:hypothetical protein BN2476_230326 [Paraburkholderia piptadeniae]|uniref:Uncharacterized protein n=1 Tax=Paraburkholderia piptadeniae TaxID=1701573 RepID=A0A1N7RXX0_9BURK|nr:hypothetical protein BN2476_230326 [Paraburkholderia piptadeniae]
MHPDTGRADNLADTQIGFPRHPDARAIIPVKPKFHAFL